MKQPQTDNSLMTKSTGHTTRLSIVSGDATHVAFINGETYPKEAILHAVNSHQPLIEAGLRLLNVLHMRFAKTGCNPTEESAVKQLRDAIAKAEGK